MIQIVCVDLSHFSRQMNENLAGKAGDSKSTPTDFREYGDLVKDHMSKLLELSDSEESDHGDSTVNR